MELDEKQREQVTKHVNDYLNKEGVFKAETMAANGEINARKKKALDAIFLKVAKLDISKKAFMDAIITERHVRETRSSVEKIVGGDDANRAGQSAAILLATGNVLPLVGDDGKTSLEQTVAKGAEGDGGAEGEDGGEEAETKGRRRSRTNAEQQAAGEGDQPNLH